MPRIKTWFDKQNPWTRNFAYALLFLNVVSAFGFYLAGPIHSLMSHAAFSWMPVELRLCILVVNALAAFLVTRALQASGTLLLFFTGTILLVYGLQRQNGLISSFLLSYWDVLILLFLQWRYFNKQHEHR